MKKSIFVLIVALWAGLSLVSCGGYGSSTGKGPPSGLHNRVLALEGVSSTTSFGRMVFINGQFDTLAPVAPAGAGASPSLMAISPTRDLIAALDPITDSVFTFNTNTEAPLAQVHLAGLPTSLVLPSANQVGYVTIPTASVTGFPFIGAVEAMNLSAGLIGVTIGLTNAQTVISNSTGSQLLVFNGSNSVTVLSPNNAVPPVDMSCLSSTPNNVCTVVPGFDQPVSAVVSGSTAYILNCGAECGGTQASVQTLDLGSLTVGTPIPVNGATVGFLSGSKLYVAGLGSPTGPTCASLTSSGNPKTQAVYCGTLDIVDLGTMTDPYFNSPSTEIAIPDGNHARMDMSINGQLFVGSSGCQDIGNVNNPIGEVRGCLAIYNTNTGALVIPPDNGDVTGLQSFTSRDIEYVAEGGHLRVYDTKKNILLIDDFLPQGTIDVIGHVTDVKAIDFF